MSVLVLRETREGGIRRADVAFTDARLDLQSRAGDQERFADHLSQVEDAAEVPFARASQVHGRDVVVVNHPPMRGPRTGIPTADALVSATPGIGLMVRVADCLPVLFADVAAGVIGAAHAGRKGVELDIATATVQAMNELGATTIEAWIGPHVCGGCYEVPAQMQQEVCAVVPETRATTSWGTPSLDLAAGVHAQLERCGVRVQDVGPCTLEDTAFHSHRRDGSAAGRFAGLVWLS